ncbi:hypothetical protein H0O03_04065 [Candidatus Micrarchaeota archaeon]|nr:hypothetical protein [Candidatus Micrarchaeota archaeon]
MLVRRPETFRTEAVETNVAVHALTEGKTLWGRKEKRLQQIGGDLADMVNAPSPAVEHWLHHVFKNSGYFQDHQAKNLAGYLAFDRNLLGRVAQDGVVHQAILEQTRAIPASSKVWGKEPRIKVPATTEAIVKLKSPRVADALIKALEARQDGRELLEEIRRAPAEPEHFPVPEEPGEKEGGAEEEPAGKGGKPPYGVEEGEEPRGAKEEPEKPAEKQVSLRDLIWKHALAHHIQQKDSSTLPALGKVNASLQEKRLTELLLRSQMFVNEMFPALRPHNVENLFNAAVHAEDHGAFMKKLGQMIEASTGEDGEQYVEDHRFEGKLHEDHKTISILNAHKLKDETGRELTEKQKNAHAFQLLAKYFSHALPEERAALHNYLLGEATDQNKAAAQVLRKKIVVSEE